MVIFTLHYITLHCRSSNCFNYHCDYYFDYYYYFTSCDHDLSIVEVHDPHIADLGVDPCHSMHCAQTCDPVTGMCICRRGYKLVDGSKCEGKRNCNLAAPVTGKLRETADSQSPTQKNMYGQGW